MNRRQRRRRRQARWVTLVAIGGIVAGLQAVGSVLPSMVRTTARTVVPGSPDTVWDVLLDLDGMPAWQHDLDGVERLPERLGHVRWVEVRGASRISMERVEAAARERLVVQGVDPSRPVVRRIYELNAESGGTGLVFTEEREVGLAMLRPLVRWFGPARERVHRHLGDVVGRVGSARHHIAARALRSGQGSTPQRASARVR